MNPIHQIKLKPEKERRIREGHPWIFRGDIAEYIGAFAPGDIVEVLDSAGEFLAKGYINPRSKITVRILSRQCDEKIDLPFLVRALQTAKALRTRLAGGSSVYRAFFAESDGIPGLIVDRYDEYLVLQLLTLGVDIRRDEILATLIDLYRPKGIFETSNVRGREPEGLEPRNEVVYGEVPPVVEIQLGTIRFLVDIIKGQKTGFFLDQRDNRRRFSAYIRPGDRVLDCFCYTGSFALYATMSGAEVRAIDSSKRAIEISEETARLNGVESHCRFEVGEAFDWLNHSVEAGETFDVVNLDPPAFAKERSSVQYALRGYRAINHLAIRLIAPGGFLMSNSCSQLIEESDFLNVLQSAAHDAGRTIKFLEIRGQAWDHPIAGFFPESRYLKCVIAQIV